MQSWCIYIDESGVPHSDGQPNFIYAAICVPFNDQQEFLKVYPEIVKLLQSINSSESSEIKYGRILNSLDSYFRAEYKETCNSLLERFFEIKDAKIIRVKAIKALTRKKDDDLREALFGITLDLCKNSLLSDYHAMILHDELPSRHQQIPLLNRFNRFNKDSTDGKSFQNCVFVHSNENPFVQFADFVASICYKYYDFQKNANKKKQRSKLLVNELFEKIDKHSPSIVELSDHTVVEAVVKGNPRREQAERLVSSYGIRFEKAYPIVDGQITLEETLLREQAKQLASKHSIRETTARQIVDGKITLEQVLRQKQASQLALEHDIPSETAYKIVDKKITLEEALRQK